MYESTCPFTCLLGAGNESDWAAAFWDFRSDSGTQPSIADMAATFSTIHPWTASGNNNAFYTSFSFSLGARTGMSTRWNAVADVNGINL